MAPSKKIRIGQIGIGHNHAAEKMASLRQMDDIFEVVGIAEQSSCWKEKRAHLDAYHGLPWLSEEELLGMEGLDALTIETDLPELVPTARKAIDAGLHIHLDKPGGEVLEDFAELCKDAHDRGLYIQMGYMFRGNPTIRFCVNAVRNGWLGDVSEIHAVMNRMDNADYRRWMGGFQGGTMLIFGCHLIDLILQMLGQPDNIHSFLKQTKRGQDHTRDSCLAVMEYPRATATIRTSMVEVNTAKARRQLTICGDKGTLELRPLETLVWNDPQPMTMNLTLTTPQGGYEAGTHTITFPAMQGRYLEQLNDFAAIIKGEKHAPLTVEHELLLQECTLRASGYPLRTIS